MTLLADQEVDIPSLLGDLVYGRLEGFLGSHVAHDGDHDIWVLGGGLLDHIRAPTEDIHLASTINGKSLGHVPADTCLVVSEPFRIGCIKGEMCGRNGCVQTCASASHDSDNAVDSENTLRIQHFCLGHFTNGYSEKAVGKLARR